MILQYSSGLGCLCEWLCGLLQDTRFHFCPEFVSLPIILLSTIIVAFTLISVCGVL